jgi:uncharacterized protein (UPF0216 family)
MPNPNAVVSRVVRFHPALDRTPAELLRAEGGLHVELEDGRRVRLDPANARSLGFTQVLDGLNKLRLPAYFEIDPSTSVITRLLIPQVTRVVGMNPIDRDTVGVQLERSHARHVLQRKQPDFAQLEKQLREAMQGRGPVVLTEDDAHNIIDLRPFAPSPEGPPPPFPDAGPLTRVPMPPSGSKGLFFRVWHWPWWPWWWFCCISTTKAQQVFDAMSATSCNPITVPPPCIPFLYPDDGCWARAHEMRRLMVDMGLAPKKVWIEGNLNVKTKNNPACQVSWGWHVAPTLCVRVRFWFFFFCQRRVFDPSLFSTPVSEATWMSVQGDPNAALTESEGKIYYLWGNVTDPTYAETNHYLAYYRLQLQLRATTVGPPPYAYCP